MSLDYPFDYEPMSKDHWADPYPVYKELRENAPVYKSPETGTYCLSRYEDVEFALRQPLLFSSNGMEKALMAGDGNGPGLRDLLAIGGFMLRARINPLNMLGSRPPNLITEDPPNHDDMRAVVNRGFTPRRISALEPRMREIVDGCMAKLRRGESFDVVRDLAVMLPVTVIAEMLGVEPERHADFKRWSDAIVSASTGADRSLGLRGILKPLGELRGYMRHIVKQRRLHPGDDLISVLVDPKHEETLGEEEIFGFIALLLVAGNETTTNLIGNATLALLSHPDELAKVQADPSLVPQMLEETVRWDTPVQILFRGTSDLAKLPSGTIPAGSQVALLLGSASRDASVYEDPDRFDVSRSPRPHLGFGYGVHFCLGASLARLEGKVAMEALVPELPVTREPRPTPELIDSFVVRGPRSVELLPAQ
jgi:cytochrome P450